MKDNYHVIDAKIEGLVKAMNEHDFITFASCQGHGKGLPPYIAFKATQQKTSQLIKILRSDSESMNHQLYWGWTIKGFFNEKFELCYSLTIENPHHWISQYCRSHLDNDFSKIIEYLQGL